MVVSILKNTLLSFFKGRRKKVKSDHGVKQLYTTQGVALSYCMMALLIFGFQGFVATLGALDLVFPDLPSPITFEVGRAIHLNLSVYWPLLGSMGFSYYFFIQEAKTDLHSKGLAKIQFWCLTMTVGAIIVGLLLGYTAGREYLEALPILKLGVIISLAIFVYNLLRTYLKAKKARHRVSLTGMLLGAFFILLQYVPNLFSFFNPSLDEVVRFWVVHMTEELSLELLNISAFTGLLLTLPSVKVKALESVLFFNIILTIIGGVFATGHHYYWIGSSGEWLWIGGIFSFIQVIAILLFFYLGYQSLRRLSWSELKTQEKLALAFGGTSIIYHVIGAGLMGMIMSIPQWNRYSHGTYLTSAHAHLALFGATGMLVLTGATYILTKEAALTKQEITRAWSGFILLNTGLVLMGIMLILAGVLQTYLWRVAGLSFMTTHEILRPYLLGRAVGGAIFALGDILFVSALGTMIWRRYGLHIFTR